MVCILNTLFKIEYSVKSYLIKSCSFSVLVGNLGEAFLDSHHEVGLVLKDLLNKLLSFLVLLRLASLRLEDQVLDRADLLSEALLQISLIASHDGTNHAERAFPLGTSRRVFVVGHHKHQEGLVWLIEDAFSDDLDVVAKEADLHLTFVLLLAILNLVEGGSHDGNNHVQGSHLCEERC